MYQAASSYQCFHCLHEKNNFNNYVDIVQFLGKAYLLKGSQFSIDRDYLAEILNARKQLWPRFKE